MTSPHPTHPPTPAGRTVALHLFALLATISVVAFASPLHAQRPPTATDQPPASAFDAAPARTSAPPIQFDRCPTHPWATDLLVGVPTGLRVKRLLDADAVNGWEVEGVAGFYTDLPALGGGVRYAYTPWCGRSDVISLSPGLDAYLMPNTSRSWDILFTEGRRAYGLVALDLDIGWRHAFGDSVSGEVGLKLGAGPAFGAAVPVLPVVSLFLGLRF